MNRRELLKYSFASLASGLIVPAALAQNRRDPQACDPKTHPSFHPHLQGEMPDGALPTLSSKGDYHHYHFLHIPAQVLTNPPRRFRTITSMMREEIGIDDFFFEQVHLNKQYHCHQVDITRAELMSIAEGRRVEIVAYIRSGGKPVRNHTFVFNDTITFEQKQQTAREAGDLMSFATERVACDRRGPGMVTAFHAGGVIGVSSLAQVDQLKGY